MIFVSTQQRCAGSCRTEIVADMEHFANVELAITGGTGRNM